MKISNLLRTCAFGMAIVAAPCAWAADTMSQGTTAPAPSMAGTGPALEAGANSFTEGEARNHIEKAGYTAVSALKKDDQGIWRGTASKGGATMPVGLDFKGNVSSH